MPRPLSHITEHVRDVFKARGHRPTTWRDVAAELAQRGHIDERAPAEVVLVRKTVERMGGRGELEAVARVRRPGSRRPMNGWVQRVAHAPTTDPHALLQMTLQAWAS